jgi:DNA-directed RNA polymerase subunit H (RpoH/RPB5)
MNFAEEVITSIQTLREMLLDRGYMAENLTPLQNVSNVELKTIISSNVFNISIPKEKIRIYFDLSPKFKWVDFKKHVVVEDYTYFIFVVRSSINGGDMKKIVEFDQAHQLFSIQELQFNISRHSLVPKHTLITDDGEIQEILTKYMVKKNQLPYILKSDAMSQYLNAKPGNIVRIERISPTAGISIVYRAVV